MILSPVDSTIGTIREGLTTAAMLLRIVALDGDRKGLRVLGRSAFLRALRRRTTIRGLAIKEIDHADRD